jgi:hypothetical protein
MLEGEQQTVYLLLTLSYDYVAVTATTPISSPSTTSVTRGFVRSGTALIC